MHPYAKTAALLPLLLLLTGLPSAALGASAALPEPPPPPARAKGPKGCQSKESMFVWKLAEARENDETERAAGLERALGNLKNWCANGDKQAKAEFDLWEKEQEVGERKKAVEQARVGGKPEKIARSEQKLARAVRELEAAQKAVGR